jgi:ABC-type sugar transport system ATPase subunit
MIYVTHDQVEAMTVADRIVVLKDGELQQIAAPDTIYRHPANTFVAGFIGAPSMNILKARFNRDCICIGKAVLPVPELWRQVIGQRRDLLLGIRPEHCRLSEDAAVQGSITYVENTGNQRTVELQLESGENISVTVSDRNADVQNSSGICFSWDDVSLFDVTSGRNIGYIEKGEVFTDAMGS